MKSNTFKVAIIMVALYYTLLIVYGGVTGPGLDTFISSLNTTQQYVYGVGIPLVVAILSILCTTGAVLYIFAFLLEILSAIV